MVTIQTSSKKPKHKHIKRKNRSSRHPIYLGTPQVPLSKEQDKQKHELLSDWEDAP